MSYSLNKLRFVEKSEIPGGFTIVAPVSGSVCPVANVNQPLISSGLLGEGVAVELAGNKIVAPFDGVITELPGSCHRIQLKAKNGIKLLIVMANGIDDLMGLGFDPKVTEKQSVSTGQTLLNFNLQQLQKIATPCYCAVFITNAEKIGYVFSSAKKVTAGEDVLLTLTAKQKAEPPKDAQQ